MARRLPAQVAGLLGSKNQKDLTYYALWALHSAKCGHGGERCKAWWLRCALCVTILLQQTNWLALTDLNLRLLQPAIK